MWLEEVQEFVRNSPRGEKTGAVGTGGSPQVFISWTPGKIFDIAEKELLALTGTGHALPVGWTTGPQYDPLVVGEGNYEPQPGDILYELMNEQRHAIAVWKQFEKEQPGTAKAIIEAELGAGLIMEDELLGNFQRMRDSTEAIEEQMKERDRAIAEGDGERAAAWSVLIFEAEADYKAKFEEPLSLWDQRNLAYDINGHGPPMVWAPYMRRRFGPMLHGVKKWAYRINLSKPWPGGPDLTKPTSGCIVIELRSPAGTLSPAMEPFPHSLYTEGERRGDFPWDDLPFLESGLELQIPAIHIPHPSSLAVGPIETGIVRPDPLEITAYG
jgi:hypothetical protein